MRLSSFLLVLFLLVCCSNSLVVRMSDRKPKWAVNKPQPKTEPPETIPEVHQEVQPEVEPSEPEPSQIQPNEQNQNQGIDIQSVQKKRSPLEFSGIIIHILFIKRPFCLTSFICFVCGL